MKKVNKLLVLSLLSASNFEGQYTACATGCVPQPQNLRELSQIGFEYRLNVFSNEFKKKFQIGDWTLQSGKNGKKIIPLTCEHVSNDQRFGIYNDIFVVLNHVTGIDIDDFCACSENQYKIEPGSYKVIPDWMECPKNYEYATANFNVTNGCNLIYKYNMGKTNDDCAQYDLRKKIRFDKTFFKNLSSKLKKNIIYLEIGDGMEIFPDFFKKLIVVRDGKMEIYPCGPFSDRGILKKLKTKDIGSLFENTSTTVTIIYHTGSNQIFYCLLGDSMLNAAQRNDVYSQWAERMDQNRKKCHF